MFTSPATLGGRSRRSAQDWLIGVLLLAILFGLVWFVFLRETDADRLPAASRPHSQEWYVRVYGSDPAEVGAILDSNGCAELQATFIDASEAFRAEGTSDEENRAQVGIMAASADRMNELGCPLR
jgi:hypothetical protein